MEALHSDFSRHSLNAPLGTCGTPRVCSLLTHKALCCTQQHPVDHTVLKHPRCPTLSGSLEGHLRKAKSSMSLLPFAQIHPYLEIEVLKNVMILAYEKDGLREKKRYNFSLISYLLEPLRRNIRRSCMAAMAVAAT